MRWLAISVLIGMITTAFAQGTVTEVKASKPEIRDMYSDTWAATDGLGRSLPGHDECGSPRPGRFVGIFYFTWLGPHGYDGGEPMTPDQNVVPKTKEHYNSPYDITKILAESPDAPKWGPPGAFHWWGEPLFGYYTSNDDWVIRKHAQMLANAGVDVIVCDVTNSLTYTGVYLTICKVFEDIRKTGGRTPQISFLLNSNHAAVAQKLYDEFYAKNLYPDLWFCWKGKPLLMADANGLSPQLREFFTLRRSWAWSGTEWFGDGKDRWPWLDNTPQKAGWHEDPAKPEEVAVAVAQHPTSNIGRSFHAGHEPAPGQIQPAEGLYFEEQWKRALEIDPEFVFITGWNEWVAQRFLAEEGMGFCGRKLHKGDTFFVDEYSEEYSRDIEPMKGGHGDAYYYQMASYIRRYKGVRPQPTAGPMKSIQINGDFSEWQAVTSEYHDSIGDTAPRNHPGWGAAGTYTDNAGRNDLVAMKVARDSENVYFYARTQEPISPHTDPNWMMLFLRIDGNAPNWEGFNFVVNRRGISEATTRLERCEGGWHWRRIAEISYAVRGCEMELAIPRAALGIATGRGPLRIEFKWADNVPVGGSIVDWLASSGDTAPDGRFRYVFRAE